MRRCLKWTALVVTFTALHGCGTAPTAPRQTGPAAFDPAALFAKLAGPYTLTFEADESCPLPPSLNVLIYGVWLAHTVPHNYIGARVLGKDFVGGLWALARKEEGLKFRWNVDCEASDTVESTSFYLCGEGAAAVDADGTISGFLREFTIIYRPFCTNGSHRFVFQRRN